MDNFKLLTSGLLLAGFSSLAVANSQAMPERYTYIGGHISEHFYDFNSRGADRLRNTTLPGAQIGHRFNPNWSVQAWWGRNNNSKFRESGNKTDLNLALASVRYHYQDASLFGFEPYTGINVGEQTLDLHGGAKHDETIVGAEFGLQKRLREHWILDVGARPFYSTDNEHWDGETYAALNYAFGVQGSSSRRAAAESEPEETPPQETVIIVTPGDLDGDGVSDDRDQCPNTPAGVAVDANGCPLDSDGDGVPDYQDQCPNTPARAKVDENGCQVVLTSDLRETLYIEFELGRAEVRATSMDEVNKIANMMYEYPSARLLIEGHSDSSGARAFNLSLSEQRADAVKRILVQRHEIDESRIETVGYGPDKPIANNDTAEGRAQNRRVEIVLRAQLQEAQFEE